MDNSNNVNDNSNDNNDNEKNEINEKKINIQGKNNRYQMKKLINEPKEIKKRVESKNWNFDNMYFEYENQCKLVFDILKKFKLFNLGHLLQFL